MYSENPNGVFSAPNHHRSKTRTLHLSDKSQNGLYISEEIDKFEKEALSRRIHFLSDENQRLKSQLDGFDFEYSKLSREKAEENEFLQMGKLDLEREIITVKMKLEELSNEIDSQKEENQKLSEQNENLLQKIDELGKNYEKMKNTNQSLSLRIQNNSFHYNKEFETVNYILF